MLTRPEDPSREVDYQRAVAAPTNINGIKVGRVIANDPLARPRMPEQNALNDYARRELRGIGMTHDLNVIASNKNLNWSARHVRMLIEPHRERIFAVAKRLNKSIRESKRRNKKKEKTGDEFH